MRVAVLETVCCIAIAVAGLVPVAHKNKPFWGAYGISIDHGPPRLYRIEDGSPAQASGLQRDDVVLAVNGSPVDNSGMTTALEALGPGEEARFRVQRGSAELDLIARGVEPPVAMIYYPTFGHPVAGGVGLAMGLLVLATQPLRPAPLWRSALVTMVGLGCGIVFFLALVHDSPFAWWKLRQYHTLNWGERIHFGQTWIGLVASLVLAVLAAWELRGLLTLRATGPGTTQPAAGEGTMRVEPAARDE